MSYYNLKDTLKRFKKELPDHLKPFGLPQLADLCRRGTITPVFSYQRHTHFIDDELHTPHPQPHLFQSYLTSTDLLLLFNNQTPTVIINRATIYEALSDTHLKADDEILLTENNFHHSLSVLEDNDFYTTFFTIPESPYPVTLNDLLFPSEQVQTYLALHHFADLTTPDQQRIAELESLLAQANADNAKLMQQLNTPANDDSAHDKDSPHGIDWQNMSEHVYPPELHLALMIWQRIYIDQELKDTHPHTTSHAGKFKVIAKSIGLDPEIGLGTRVEVLTNIAANKKGQRLLATPLRAIKGLNMPAPTAKPTP